MKEATYFQAKGNSFFITKKHIAVIFFVWWLFINFYIYILTPFTFYIYKSITEFGDQPILEENITNKNEKNQDTDIEQTQQSQQIKRVKPKKKDKDSLNSKQIQIQSAQATDNGKNTDLFREQIKMTFKIKGKKSEMQKMKKQMAQQSLKLAMQAYYQQKNDIKNYQEEF